MERAAVVAGGDLLIGSLGVGERRFGADGDKGVEFVVKSFESLERRLKCFHRRNLACGNEPREIGQAQV